jgi:hypothetical protein
MCAPPPYPLLLFPWARECCCVQPTDPLGAPVAYSEQILTTGINGLLGSVVFVRNNTGVLVSPALERVRS